MREGKKETATKRISFMKPTASHVEKKKKKKLERKRWEEKKRYIKLSILGKAHGPSMSAVLNIWKTIIT